MAMVTLHLELLKDKLDFKGTQRNTQKSLDFREVLEIRKQLLILGTPGPHIFALGLGLLMCKMRSELGSNRVHITTQGHGHGDRRDIWAVCIELWQGNEQCSQQCTEYCTEEQPTEWSLVPTHRRGLSLKTGVASSNVATFYSQNWSSSATLMTFWWPLPPFVSIPS